MKPGSENYKGFKLINRLNFEKSLRACLAAVIPTPGPGLNTPGKPVVRVVIDADEDNGLKTLNLLKNKYENMIREYNNNNIHNKNKYNKDVQNINVFYDELMTLIRNDRDKRLNELKGKYEENKNNIENILESVNNQVNSITNCINKVNSNIEMMPTADQVDKRKQVNMAMINTAINNDEQFHIDFSDAYSTIDVVKDIEAFKKGLTKCCNVNDDNAFIDSMITDMTGLNIPDLPLQGRKRSTGVTQTGNVEIKRSNNEEISNAEEPLMMLFNRNRYMYEYIVVISDN